MGDMLTERTLGQNSDLAVDQVVRHLVMLRGGGAFLSSRDALQLVTWLDEGHPVDAILDALDRAAEARRARRSRVPLALKHAKRHLERTATVVPPQHPLLETMSMVAAADEHREAMLRLRGRLMRLLEDRTVQPAQGVEAMRAFFEDAWSGLGSAKRDALLFDAKQNLGDLLTGLDASTCSTLLEETARSRLRAGYPWLTVAAVRALFQTRQECE